MRTMLFSGLAVSLFAFALAAQELPEFPKPQKEHEWLKQFVGEWDCESECIPAPGQPPMKGKGTTSSRMLGGFWVVSEIKTEMMGATMNAVQTIGYDTDRKKYVGTWIDSVLNHLWKYEGSVDATGKILTVEAEGPNMMQPGKLAKFRDIYEFKSADHIVTSSAMQDGEGKWTNFATGTLRRKK